MKKYQMVIDVKKCENCNNCFLSCKDEHFLNDWPGYSQSQPLHGHRWMNILQKEHGKFPHISVVYKPKPCLHCDDAVCIRSSKNGEIYKRNDGIVLIDPVKAKGNKDLVKACPYGAIWWNEEKEVAQKCTLCAHLLDSGWKAPRCAQACPTGALTFQLIEIEQRDRFIDTHSLKNYNETKEVAADTVLYKNKELFDGFFLAGTVATKKDMVEDCVKGAEIELLKDNDLVANVGTDAFGDFRFHGLLRGRGTYQLKIKRDNQYIKELEVECEENAFIGTIWI